MTMWFNIMTISAKYTSSHATLAQAFRVEVFKLWISFKMTFLKSKAMTHIKILLKGITLIF